MTAPRMFDPLLVLQPKRDDPWTVGEDVDYVAELILDCQNNQELLDFCQ